MPIRSGTAVGRLPSLSLGRREQRHAGSERENLFVLHAAERQCEQAFSLRRRVSVALMKGIADNPHDEHLSAERAEGQGEIFSQPEVPPHTV